MNQFSMVSKLHVNQGAYAAQIATLKVLISSTGPKKPTQQRAHSPTPGAETSTAAVQNQPKKPKTAGKRSAAAAATANGTPAGSGGVNASGAAVAQAIRPSGNDFINLVSDDEEDALAADPAAQMRFQVMKLMLSQLSKALRDHTGASRIPLSTTVQDNIAKRPPRTSEELQTMTISGLSKHMKQRYGPAILQGVAQADAHIAAVEQGIATVESFQLNAAIALQGMTAGGGGNGGKGNQPNQGGQQQQQQQQPRQGGTQRPQQQPPYQNHQAAKRLHEDADWDNDFVDDDDDDDDIPWNTGAGSAAPVAHAPPPAAQQHQAQQPWAIPAVQAAGSHRYPQQQQQYNQAPFQQYNYAAAHNSTNNLPPGAAPGPAPPPQPPLQHYGAVQPPKKQPRLINPAPAEPPVQRPSGDNLSLAQRKQQLELKAKLRQELAAHDRKDQPRYQPGSGVQSMAVDDISNVFG